MTARRYLLEGERVELRASFTTSTPRCAMAAVAGTLTQQRRQ
jgi:hypothetical protein